MDGGEDHLAWSISENIFEYAAADVRQMVVLALGACYVQMVVLALGACYVQRTLDLEECRDQAPVAAACDRVIKLGIL